MPYKNIKDLPERIKGNLPKHAQEIYRESFNNAWKQYEDPKERKGNASREEVSHKVAWAAVKQKYEKIKNDWKEKND
ncbi:MAG: ChaB family protein [Candidatus Pacebacteria bacterium]|jgi:cation transport regulator|nr:ChaB family protein [Candidatus Paceibacterota bacterium]